VDNVNPCVYSPPLGVDRRPGPIHLAGEERMSQDRKRRMLAVAATTTIALGTLVPLTAGAQSPDPAASMPAMPALPTPEKTELSIGLSVTETSQYAAKLAEQAGIWQKYGITPTVTVFEGDGKTMQALQAGQLDIGFIGVSAALNSQVTDAPVTILSTNATILSDNIVAVPSVTNADELRGQCLAVSTFGGTSHGAALLGLQALGLTPEDVVITEVGGQSARIAALEGGACQAAVVDVALEQQMLESGFNVLVNLKEAGLPWGRSGLGVTDEWLAANPNTALVALAATLEAQNMMWADADAAAGFYDAFRELGDLETSLSLIEDFQTIGNRTMMWENEAFENPKTILATVNPDISDVDVTTAFDRSYLEQLVTMGVYDALGVPLE
jgi:ABC-type nitrate/sulfonate/bicarbonate transport system substrate-binding protein